MAIFIETEEQLSNPIRQYHLHSVPEDLKKDPSKVLSVSVDGHELAHIIRNFPNVHTRNGRRVVKFYGEEAKFIIGNW